MPISIPLIKRYGSIGAALGTALALFCGTWLFMNIFYHKKIGLNMLYYWKQIFKFVPAFIPSLISGIVLNMLFNCFDWLKLLSAIAIYIIIYSVSMLLWGFNTEEKQMIMPILKKYQISERVIIKDRSCLNYYYRCLRLWINL